MQKNYLERRSDQSYEAFRNLYQELEETLQTDYQQDLWLKKREEYIKRLKEIALITEYDPQKLKAIKQGLIFCRIQPNAYPLIIPSEQLL